MLFEEILFAQALCLAKECAFKEPLNNHATNCIYDTIFLPPGGVVKYQGKTEFAEWEGVHKYESVKKAASEANLG